MITQKVLQELFKVDVENGKFFYKTKVKRHEVGEEAGWIYTEKTGIQRWKISIKGRGYLRSRLLFLYMKGYMPEMVDHENHDTLNDSWRNLREANREQNNYNRRTNITSVTGIKGLSIQGKRMIARLRYNGYRYHKQLTYNEETKEKVEKELTKWLNEKRKLFHKEFAHNG